MHRDHRRRKHTPAIQCTSRYKDWPAGGFVERMCYHRCRHIVVSLAVLADGTPGCPPRRFQVGRRASQPHRHLQRLGCGPELRR